MRYVKDFVLIYLQFFKRTSTARPAISPIWSFWPIETERMQADNVGEKGDHEYER